MTVVGIIVFALYVLLIGSFCFGFSKVNVFKLKDLQPQTKFSIIIPFRNEAENLPALLYSILKLNYPRTHFEVIFVNDASEDTSVEIIKNTVESEAINVKIINNQRQSNSPKKDAITTAINHAQNPWIVTTDADCILPQFWLDSYNGFIVKTNAQMVCGPVTYHNPNGFLQWFQLLDLFSLVGATMGGFGINRPFLCNGANLVYTQDLFLSLDGYNGNGNIASGDDIFLLEKAVKQDKSAVGFLKSKSAIVTTNAMPSVKSLIAQRKRWASKTSGYSNGFGKLTGLLVLLANAFLVCAFALWVTGNFSGLVLGVLLLSKLTVDYILLRKTTRFFRQKFSVVTFVLSGLLYPLFSVFIAVASVFSGYKWKGRAFKK